MNTSTNQLRTAIIARINQFASDLSDVSLIGLFSAMAQMAAHEEIHASQAKDAEAKVRSQSRKRRPVKKTKVAALAPSPVTAPETKTEPPTFTSQVVSALTKDPQRPVDVHNKLVEAKVIKAGNAKSKNKVNVTLNNLYKRKLITKDGSSYRVI